MPEQIKQGDRVRVLNRNLVGDRGGVVTKTQSQSGGWDLRSQIVWVKLDGSSLKSQSFPAERVYPEGRVVIPQETRTGPSRRGSALCRNGSSIAAGGTVEYCTCRACF